MQSQSLSATETFSCAGDGRYKPIVLKLLGMGHAQQDLHEAMLQSDAQFAMLRALIQKSFVRFTNPLRPCNKLQSQAASFYIILWGCCGWPIFIRAARLGGGISLIWRMLPRTYDADFCLSVRASLHAELLGYSANQRTALSISAEKPV